MLEAALSLLLAALAAIAGYQATQRADDASRAMSQADVLASVRQAVETLVFEKYLEYQAGLPITRNGVTLAPGTAAGQAMRPTVAQLRTMALGIDGAGDTGFYKSLSSAGYLINIQRVPAGCEAAPNPANGTACNIAGTVCFDQPVRAYGAAVGEEDGLAIGKMLGRIGGNGGASVLGAAANITGTGGGWTIANPIAGQPPGTELLVGFSRDSLWGPVMAVGLGGVWVEVLQDVALRPLPVSAQEARRMLKSLRGLPLLQGHRGLPAAHLDVLATVIARISQAITAMGPDLLELDINPLWVRGDQVEALDALMVWRPDGTAVKSTQHSAPAVHLL